MRLSRLLVVAALTLTTVAPTASAGSKVQPADPTSSRLRAGSVAILDPDEPRPRASVAVYYLPVLERRGRARWIAVRARSRVEILDDTKPSVVNTFETDGGEVKGEDRDVKIKVLDGANAGFTGYTSRFYLRAAR